jgi:predicted translin family RNA/ssDNA-binding protein
LFSFKLTCWGKVPLHTSPDFDIFHITTEEYLLALCHLPDELARLATNAVTIKDFEHAVHIQAFVKDLFAGFLLLNLKNDILRRKVDGVKYSVKKTEEIVYDLTVRNLVPGPAEATEDGKGGE